MSNTRKDIFKLSEERRQAVLDMLLKKEGMSTEEISVKLELNLNSTTLLLRGMITLEELTVEKVHHLRKFSAAVLVTRTAESLLVERSIKAAAKFAKKVSHEDSQIFRIKGLPMITHLCSDTEHPIVGYKERPRKNMYAKGTSSIMGGTLL